MLVKLTAPCACVLSSTSYLPLHRLSLAFFESTNSQLSREYVMSALKHRLLCVNTISRRNLSLAILLSFTTRDVLQGFGPWRCFPAKSFS